MSLQELSSYRSLESVVVLPFAASSIIRLLTLPQSGISIPMSQDVHPARDPDSNISIIICMETPCNGLAAIWQNRLSPAHEMAMSSLSEAPSERGGVAAAATE